MRGTISNFRADFHHGLSCQRDTVMVEIGRIIPYSGRWSEVHVRQDYQLSASTGLIEALLTIRFANNSQEFVEAHNPLRLLAFRGPVEVSVQPIRGSFGVVAVLLLYSCRWSGMEQLLCDIELDAQTIEVWLESNPVHKAEEAATA